jgi:hypothetical protein
MKSSHRLDIIGMALEYVYQKSTERLGMNLHLLFSILN